MFEAKEGIIKPIIYVGVIRDNKLLLVDYKIAPNPTKSGWWIPAPGLEFGEDPSEKAAAVLNELGYPNAQPQLHGVESFVLPGGWHLIYHFISHVSGDVASNNNIKAHKWITAQELENMKDIAHGKWEIGVGKSYLQKV
jgi:hypothetical protein